ncbi:hypothetical protein [Pseudomonas lactis]|uniref:hypothetical protein n=1 Tax=Pseudomonas lactis TaxID=1615674 RepID=UPI003F80A6AA
MMHPNSSPHPLPTSSTFDESRSEAYQLKAIAHQFSAEASACTDHQAAIRPSLTADSSCPNNSFIKGERFILVDFRLTSPAGLLNEFSGATESTKAQFREHAHHYVVSGELLQSDQLFRLTAFGYLKPELQLSSPVDMLNYGVGKFEFDAYFHFLAGLRQQDLKRFCHVCVDSRAMVFGLSSAGNVVTSLWLKEYLWSEEPRLIRQLSSLS